MTIEASIDATAAGRLRAIGEPVNVSSGDPRLDPRPADYPYSRPPNMRTVPPGSPLDLGSLDPALTYMWVVDPAGNFLFAPERQRTSDFGKRRPPDMVFSIKHGDLVPGAQGRSRGPARAGGRLHNIPDADGRPGPRWLLDNDSSYTFARVGTDGARLPVAPVESLHAVRDQLVAGGTDGALLVASDVAVERRAARDAGDQA